MSEKNRLKMNRKDRAKQFIPFAALKEYPELLKQKEKRISFRKELSEEMLEQLDRTLRQAQKGEIIKITYFSRGEYRELTGTLLKIDENRRRLQIGDRNISIEDICKLERIF